MVFGLAFSVSLLVVVALLSVVSRRIGAAEPIILLPAGIAMAFLPGLPPIDTDPDLILLALLPPLLYSSGVGMSWRGFRSNLRPILLLAIGCVLFTATAVAAVAHVALGFTWAQGLVLGAIVSPPDAVAPMAVMRRLRIPRRILIVLEGESLVNDATALVTLAFAITAVTTNTFAPSQAALRFALVVVGELGYGILVGHVLLQFRHYADEPRAEIVLALATPYLAFWPPHELGGSGVVACVAAGLWVSWHGRTLIRPATRLPGYFIWDLVVWIVEGLAFLVAGLQARGVFDTAVGEGWRSYALAGVLVSATIIVVRFLWVFPATYGPRWFLPGMARKDPAPPWRWVFLIAFSGLRGAVSLAAALSVPETFNGGPFPHRDLILFAAVCAILATLVGQGSLLGPVIAWLSLTEDGDVEAKRLKRDEQQARLSGLDRVIATIEEAEVSGRYSRETIEALRRRHTDRRALLAVSADNSERDPVVDETELQLSLIAAERAEIANAYLLGQISDEARRRVEREFDLEEARARHAVVSGSMRLPRE